MGQNCAFRPRQNELDESPVPQVAKPIASGKDSLFSRRCEDCDRYCEVVQRNEGVWFHSGGQDVFVHINAVERAGLRELRDGQKIFYELAQDRRSGRSSAEQLQAQ